MICFWCIMLSFEQRDTTLTHLPPNLYGSLIYMFLYGIAEVSCYVPIPNLYGCSILSFEVGEGVYLK